MIPKVVYTAHLANSPLPDSFRLWQATWREHHPEWDIAIITLDTRPPIMNHRAWTESFHLPEPAGSATRLNLLRYEVLAREGGVFVDPDRLPVRPIDDLLEGVGAFCTTVDMNGQPHMLSPSVLGAVRNHPAIWHCVRDLPHSVAVYRGVWDQTGPGFLSRVVREHGHFRDVTAYHWALTEQAEPEARAHGAAFLYNASAKPAEAAA